MDALYRYILDHSSAQTDALAWIERQTNIRTNHARMLSGAVQGRFLTMLTRMISPSRALELGTFTGYSAVCIAGGLPENGHLDTLEINDELEDIITEGLEMAGVSGKVSLHIGDAKDTLKGWPQASMREKSSTGSYTWMPTKGSIRNITVSSSTC